MNADKRKTNKKGWEKKGTGGEERLKDHCVLTQEALRGGGGKLQVDNPDLWGEKNCQNRSNDTWHPRFCGGFKGKKKKYPEEARAPTAVQIVYLVLEVAIIKASCQNGGGLG